MEDDAIGAGARPGRRSAVTGLIPLVLVVAVMVSPTMAGASTTNRSKPGASRDTKAHAKANGKAGAKSKTKGHAAKLPPPAPPAPAVPPRATGKVAVFLFDGDGAVPLRARVVHLLRSRGLQITTNLRPFDSAEQYRETADALGLAAFIDGEGSEDGDQASVTVHVRSGLSGLRVASATLAGERRKLAGEVDKSLWAQLGPSLARVCDDAAKPRKHEREPMRIEAGTPLDSPPKDRRSDDTKVEGKIEGKAEGKPEGKTEGKPDSKIEGKERDKGDRGDTKARSPSAG